MDVANPQMDCESAFIVRDIPFVCVFVCNKSCFHFFRFVCESHQFQKHWLVFVLLFLKKSVYIKTEHIWSIKDFSI